jgi:hypothetical protein
MSEIEERLRVLEEKNAALEKRVDELEVHARLVNAMASSDVILSEAMEGAKSKRDIAIAAAEVAFTMTFACLTRGDESTVRESFARDPETMAHDILDVFASKPGFPDAVTNNLRMAAAMARECSVKLGELKLA